MHKPNQFEFELDRSQHPYLLGPSTARGSPIKHKKSPPHPTTPIFKSKKNYQALPCIIKPSYETKQDIKGFKKKKRKKRETLEREIEMREAHT